jgi:tetratricopeptide (TPR) repeat protein
MAKPVADLIHACRTAFTAGDFEAVLRLTGLLAARHPERPEPWKVRAEAFVGLARHGEAADAYDRALALAPRDAALRVRRARALASAARHTEARAEYERAFAEAPGSLSALHGLVGYREFDPDDPALSEVRAMARGAPASPGARAFACFLLARILTLAGRDAEGFALYADANRLTREALRDAPAARGPEEFLHSWTTSDLIPAPIAPTGGRPECPAVLIAGLPRSGKSLVEHLLSAHPALAPGEELGELHEVIEALSGRPRERLAALVAARPDPLAESYAQALAASSRPAAQRIMDTAPANLWDLGYLAALHPEVPVILCRRRAADLGAAIFFKKFRVGHAWSYDQSELGRMIALAERAIDLWQRALPNPVQVVDYEALVADPRGVRDALLKELGLDPAQCGTASDPRSDPSPQGNDHDDLARFGTPAVTTNTTPAPRAHASHSPHGYGEVTAELVGFGARFAHGLAPMLAAYRAARG